MSHTTQTHSSDYACVRLTLDLDRLPGAHLASIIEEVQALVGEHVLLTELRNEPVVLEFSGPQAMLERLRASVTQVGLRRGNGRWQMTVGLVCRHSLPLPRRDRLVLLVDGDDARSRRDADVLSRAGIEPCVVPSVGGAVVLLRHSSLPFDAVMLRHHLPQGNGLQVLDRVRADQRRCSVLVIDDKARPEIARAYRGRGAFRYVGCPEGSVQLVTQVNATILDTQGWRQVEEPSASERDEPPRLLVDPDHAAARLQYVCQLTQVEREVASMVLRGLRDLDIAQRLGKSERTAKRYVGKVLEKAGVTNRASLWAVLHQDGVGGLSASAAANHGPERPLDEGIELPASPSVEAVPEAVTA